MKIAMIGPSYPFRGGIAQHTTLLYRHLRREHEVSFYGFKRQYPAWLFPGKTDRDNSKQPLTEPGIEYLLDSMNPWSWFQVFRRICAEQPEVVIIPWWTFFWTPQFLTLASLLKTVSKSRLLFICHNVFDHDSRFLSRFCAKAVLPLGDHFVVHSEEDLNRLSALVGVEKITLGFLPLFEWDDSPTLSPVDAKHHLGLEGDVLLFFGFIRPYKGVPDLLQALRFIVRERKVTLLLVGESWDTEDSLARQIQELELGEHIKRIEGYVPNEEMGLYFSAADLVVLPYISGTGSGVVQNAFAFDRPVIGTRVGSLPQTVDHGRTGYLVEPGDHQALAEAVLRFFREGKAEEFKANIRVEKKKFEWDRLVQVLEQAVIETPTNLQPTIVADTEYNRRQA
ncbi:MAG TPA: glycosyltransferase family 4 protein [Acidobacteriota bacterium]|nr:glycosyltransferase family 4 protein [Acidobacteriota bacterium]